MALLNRCIFLPVSAGLADFVVSASVPGFQTPALAGAVSGSTLSYVASSSDNLLWEIGHGVYTVVSGVATLARTTISASSAGGAKVNFNLVPTVAIDALAEDVIPLTTAITGNFPTVAEIFVSQINITSDNGAYGEALNYFGVNASFGGPAMTGTRAGITVNLTQTAPSNPGSIQDPLRFYVGFVSNTIVSGSGDGGTGVTVSTAKGGYYGANFVVRSSATNTEFLVGSEDNIFGSAAATQAFQLGHNVQGLFVNNGAVLDAAYCISMSTDFPDYGTNGGPGPGWGFGIVAAEVGNGFTPLAPTGTFLGGFVTGISDIPLKYVLDMRTFLCSQFQIIGPGFTLDPSGNAAFGDGFGVADVRINGGNSGSSGGVLRLGVGGTFATELGNVGALLGGIDNTSALLAFFGLKLFTNNVPAFSIDTSQHLQLPAYTTPGILVNDASGNVTTDSAIATATTPGNFSANRRLPVNIGGTTYFIGLDTATW